MFCGLGPILFFFSSLHGQTGYMSHFIAQQAKMYLLLLQTWTCFFSCFFYFMYTCVYGGGGGGGWMWGSFLLHLSGGVAVSGVGERSFSFMKLWWWLLLNLVFDQKQVFQMLPCNHFRLKIMWEMVLMYSEGLSWTKFLLNCMHLCDLPVKISLGLDKIIGNIARSMSVPIKYKIVHFCTDVFWTLSVHHTLCADWRQFNGVLHA